MKKILTIAFGIMLLAACGGKKQQQNIATSTAVDYTAVAIPNFDADSAMGFVAAQLDFGFRYPGSKGQLQCAQYLAHKMAEWCDTVMVQDFTTQLWDGQSVKGKNIIASMDPENQKRVLLAAHWDSRMWADHDPDEANHKKPIMGANDGASGVGALMEMARVMSKMRPGVGIDFIFFDVEDQGIADWAEDVYEDNSWCKGSQYWAQNPHVPYYRAVYGVLFDMVGTSQPRFTKEQVSMNYAAGIMNKMWSAAEAMGMGNVFVDRKTDPILDDHMYVNQIIKIPMIDIVQNTESCSFYPYWHTVGDNIDKIDKNSLKIVADVTLKTIYADYPHLDK